MKYRINWKSVSKWVGTECTELEGDELFDTKEEAEAALAAFEQDSDYMDSVHDAAVEGQGVEGFLSIEEVR